MLQNPKLKELSLIGYGLGLSGRSVVNFFKKKKLKILKSGMTTIKEFLKSTE